MPPALQFLSIRGALHGWLSFASVGAILVLWAPLGNAAAYIALILAILAAIAGFDKTTLRAVLAQRWVQMYLAAFVLIAAAFSLNAKAPADAAYIGDFSVLVLVVPIALAFAGLKARLNTDAIAALCLAGAFGAVLTAVYDVVLMGEARAHGLENSPIHFGAIASIVGFMALAGTLRGTSRWRIVFYLGPIFGAVAAALSGTRSVVLVLGALMVLFAVFALLRRPGRTAVKLAYAGLACGVVVAGVLVANAFGVVRMFGALDALGQVLSGQQLADTSSAYRIEMYRSGFLAFLDSPIIGHGWRQQVTSALVHMSEFGKAGYTNEGWAYIHNEPLGFAISGGVLGLLTYGLMMSAPLVGAIMRPVDTQTEAALYLCLCVVGGLFVAGMTDVLFMSELAKTFLVMTAAAVLIACRDDGVLDAGRSHG